MNNVYPLLPSVNQKALKLLFEDQDYPQATSYISTVLSRPVSEKEVYQDFTRPYLLYLLGLANELHGEDKQAVNAYWQVWHTYPDSPYAIMAQDKIELIK